MLRPSLTWARWRSSIGTPDGRMAAFRREARGGKSGLHGSTVPGNARRGRPQGKCHRNIPPTPLSARAARVKWCGKSAPRCRQRRRQGKPHREQDQVGTAGRGSRRGQAGFRAAVRVGRARRPATGVPEEWPSPALRRGQNPAYRPSGTFHSNRAIEQRHVGVDLELRATSNRLAGSFTYALTQGFTNSIDCP